VAEFGPSFADFLRDAVEFGELARGRVVDERSANVFDVPWSGVANDVCR
jgi:hypothetical protein